MNDTIIQELIRDKDAFFIALRKNDEIFDVLRGRFAPGKVAHAHTVTLEDSSRICFKFFDTIKYLIDSKLQRRPDRDSFLCYFEVCVYPAGQKAYCRVFDAKTVPCQPPKDVAKAKHEKNIAKLKEVADKLSIDLTDPSSWCNVYCETYNK